MAGAVPPPGGGPAPTPVAADAFRRLIARWATGVSVVTTHEGSHDFGLTVNALLSVALAPPLLLVSLSRDADTTPALERSGTFGVTMLAADQRPLSERFARPVPSAEKFVGLAFHRGPLGSAILDGGLGALECRVTARHPAADHLLVVGEVVHAEAGPDAPPLLFFRSRYAESTGPDRLTLPPPRT